MLIKNLSRHIHLTREETFIICLVLVTFLTGLITLNVVEKTTTPDVSEPVFYLPYEKPSETSH